MYNPIWYLFEQASVYIEGEEIYTGFFCDRLGNVSWFTCVYNKEKYLSKIITFGGFKNDFRKEERVSR